MRSFQSILIALVLFAGTRSQAQDSLPRFLKKVYRCIELSVPASADRFVKEEQKTQYYIVDLRLDSAGKITSADYLGKPGLKSAAYLDQAVTRISASRLQAMPAGPKRILIPVYITFSEDHPVYDLPFLKEGITHGAIDPNAYVTEDLIITAFDTHSKKNASTDRIVKNK